MKITFDEKILEKLSALRNQADAEGAEVQFVLDFDHTLAREAVSTDCCGITRYRLVAVDEVPSVFDGQIPSNAGPIYFKQWGAMYLDQSMQIRSIPNGLIQIMGEGELIANNMQIVDYRNEKVIA